ncbi:lanthionine synthetase LanC family protein [Actinopolymorpha sp. NPDC004070]|uniref:lanthionine synthetase LanC family protein n=1 Tax=Actinopolymorpha sp. NPDC004070 TaxID=3154548 RepID=UPI0033BB3FD4
MYPPDDAVFARIDVVFTRIAPRIATGFGAGAESGGAESHAGARPRLGAAPSDVPGPRGLHGLRGPARAAESTGDDQAEEPPPGETLRQWVRRHCAGGAGVPADLAVAMARRLVALVGAAHRAGCPLGDLSPDRFVAHVDGSLTLADPSAPTASTPPAPLTYSEPFRDPASGGSDPIAADLYGLGCLFFLLATGSEPLLPADDPAGSPPSRRCNRDRLTAWLAVIAPYGDTARLLAPAIGELLAPRPADRCGLAALERLLCDTVPEPPVPVPYPPANGQPSGDELLADGLDHLTARMCPDGERLWPTGTEGTRTDPCDVQHGAAGVLAVLLRAHTHGASFDLAPVTLDAAARKAAGWLAERAECAGRTGPSLPGLYSGRAGVAWVLGEAAAVLGEPPLFAQAERLALRLPTSWPTADLAHGLAGAALTHLHLAALTCDDARPTVRDTRFGVRAAGYTKALLSAAEPGPHGPTWPARASTAEAAGGSYGFAHGVAGIGYTLLALGTALDDSAALTLAGEAGDALCRAAHTDENGAAWWPAGPREAGWRPHWCSGSSGVGTFLLRLYAVTGEQRFAEYARAAAGAAYRARWTASPVACHGLAGDGEFLLDTAELLDDPTYRAWAEDLVPLLAVRHCRRGGKALVADDTLTGVVADYNVGLAGVLAFLTRLRYGGRRMFLVDDLLVDDHLWGRAARR